MTKRVKPAHGLHNCYQGSKYLVETGAGPMARPKSKNPKANQIQVRVTDEELDVLIALAHLEGITPNALVRRLVESEVHRMENDPAVVADRENRRRYQAQKDGGVVPIRPGSRAKGS